MYIKYIVCEIKNNSEKEFSAAQEQWMVTQNVVGFIGQVGGWDLKNKKTACIISFWENEKYLQLFMKNIHDKIFLNNNQSKYYNSINVSYFNSILKHQSLAYALSNAKLLIIDDCRIKVEKVDHFEMVRKNIWLSGMEKIKGMLVGQFSKAANETTRYLESTFWDSIENYTNYTKEENPKYKIEFNVKDDIKQNEERQILLVNSWKIIK